MKQHDSVVLDANIVKGVFEEEVHGTHSLTAAPGAFLAELREKECRLILDDGEHIQSEWQGPVDADWFEAWFSNLATQLTLVIISCGSHAALIKKLQTAHGFPPSENKWLVKAAATAATASGSCVLATEDMDFYDPTKKKNPKARQQHLDGTRVGPVKKTLRGAGVEVLSLCLC